MQEESLEIEDLEDFVGTYTFTTNNDGKLRSISYLEGSGYSKTISFGAGSAKVKMALLSLLEKDLCGMSREGC
ncbi:MAG: hypothetical protein ACE5OZ_24830 [Candidatus Heimdallarchaeota archaeon]